MSLRKEVFQSKVLQRLYPGEEERRGLRPADQKQSSLTPPAERPQSIPQDEFDKKKRQTAVPRKKLYTVLPPPEGYLTTSGNESVTPANPDSVGSEDSTADTDDHTLHAKRKRRRKRKVFTKTAIKDGGQISTPPAEGAADSQKDVSVASDEGNTGGSQSPEGKEPLSKNRKRKMKKKRHKEKLFALGLVPRARALEFTYKHSDEGGEGRSEEVLDFLRNIQEIHLSDRSRAKSEPPLSLSAVDSLFSRLSGETLPPAEISKLCGLKTLLVKNEEQLKLQLQEFRDTSTLPEDEISVVCTLIKYWLSEILPIQRETP